MSDLQILTGVSILISGFIQLPCGLSCYHMNILAYLAWFSSLTHLACLTFLRNYLYNRPGERAWRLVTMGILVVLLITALIPTGDYSWPNGFGYEHPLPSDYAICYFGRRKNSDFYLTFTSMILSVLLIGLGFIFRVIRLYKLLSVDLVGKAKQKTSKMLRKCLRRLFKMCAVQKYPGGLRHLFIYRPAFAIFIMLRVVWDAWSSMFVEVSSKHSLNFQHTIAICLADDL